MSTKSNLQPNFTVSYTDPEFGSKIGPIMKEYGVLVIEDVFSPDQCNLWMNDFVSAFQNISPSLKIDSGKNLRYTWLDEAMFPQTRKGLHQRGYSYLSWPVRQDPKVHEIFCNLYSHLKQKPIQELVTSIDAINIRPPIEPFNKPNARDWAHVDQTLNSNPYFCIQGQAVLTNTTASFRCSPKSHKIFNEEIHKKVHRIKKHRSNFYKFSDKEIQSIKPKVIDAGGEWQVPIQTKAGSMIFWFSCVIHSAKLAERITNYQIDPEDPWKHWRGVAYVCLRPREDVDGKHLRTIQKAFNENRTTNHWGDTIFDLYPFHYNPTTYNDHITDLINEPHRVFEIPGVNRPELTPLGKQLLGLSE